MSECFPRMQLSADTLQHGRHLGPFHWLRVTQHKTRAPAHMHRDNKLSHKRFVHVVTVNQGYGQIIINIFRIFYYFTDDQNYIF